MSYTDDDALHDAMRFMEYVDGRIERDELSDESPDAWKLRLIAWLVKRELERMKPKPAVEMVIDLRPTEDKDAKEKGKARGSKA